MGIILSIYLSSFFKWPEAKKWKKKIRGTREKGHFLPWISNLNKKLSLKSVTKDQSDQITKLEGIKMWFRSGRQESGSESKLKLFATKELWRKRIKTQWKLKAFSNDEEEIMPQKVEAIQKRLIVYERISEMSFFPTPGQTLCSKATPFLLPTSSCESCLCLGRLGRWWCFQIEYVWCILQGGPSLALTKAVQILEAGTFVGTNSWGKREAGFVRSPEWSTFHIEGLNGSGLIFYFCENLLSFPLFSFPLSLSVFLPFLPKNS